MLATMAKTENTTKAATLASRTLVAVANVVLVVTALAATALTLPASVPDVPERSACVSCAVDGCAAVVVTLSGDILIDNVPVGVAALRPLLQRLVQRDPHASVVILADRRAPVSVVLRVLEQARMAGSRDVRISTQPPMTAPDTRFHKFVTSAR
jgi:biopolymer transport protein ExbD